MDESHKSDDRIEVRMALVERDNLDIKAELKGQREQNKAHYNELRDGMTALTNQISRLIEGLEREGVYNISREELEEKAKDAAFARDMRCMMSDIARKTRNTVVTLAVCGCLALAAWVIGIKHPELFK